MSTARENGEGGGDAHHSLGDTSPAGRERGASSCVYCVFAGLPRACAPGDVSVSTEPARCIILILLISLHTACSAMRAQSHLYASSVVRSSHPTPCSTEDVPADVWEEAHLCSMLRAQQKLHSLPSIKLITTHPMANDEAFMTLAARYFWEGGSRIPPPHDPAPCSPLPLVPPFPSFPPSPHKRPCTFHMRARDSPI